MANYKVKTNTTQYDENYPYSPSEASGAIPLQDQDFSYKITDDMTYVWIHDKNLPISITAGGEYYPAVNGYSVTISRWYKSAFFIVSSSQDLGASMLGTSRLSITVSPEAAPDGYTDYVRQSRVNGYVDPYDKIMEQAQ